MIKFNPLFIYFIFLFMIIKIIRYDKFIYILNIVIMITIVFLQRKTMFEIFFNKFQKFLI